MRVTHQQALEALSELDDLEASGAEWDDEAGFETAEPTLVEHISVEVLERHGLRLAEKPAPDKQELADAVGRMVKYAKAADDFTGHAASLLPRIAAIGSWLGTAGAALLHLAGLGG